MKKTVKLALILCLIVLVSVLTLTACDITDILGKNPQESTSETTTSDETTPEETPQHIWSEWIVIKEVTCEEKGLLQRYCTECNYTESKPIDALGHTEVIDQAVAPTCTQNGWTEGKYCSTCNEVFVAQEIVNAPGHTEVIDSAVAPTCTATGLTQGKHCSVCNEVLVAQETVDAPGHSYTPTITPPTVTENGNALYTCSNCSDTYTEAIVPTDFTVTKENRAMIGYTGADGENIVIPAVFQYNGTWYRVTTIGNRAFHNCRNLTSVTIPDSVTTIGDWAFGYCSNLTSIVVDKNNPAYQAINGNLYSKDGTVLIAYAIGKTDTSFTIPDSVTTIVDSAFYNCDNLTSVTIPNSVTTIGERAFGYCSNLTSVTIPDSVTTIGNSAFSSCDNLTSIVVNENNEAYQSINGNLYSKDGTVLIAYAIGKTDTSFTIPDSVTTIGERAFYDCSNLTSVTILDSVTTIGDSAFGWCDKLTSVMIPDSVTTIGEDAFASCANLTSVTIGDSVTTIGGYAFSWCSNLTSVMIPDSVTTIGDYAFRYCSNLTSVTIGNSVTTIGDEAFYWCTKLTSITFEGTVEQWNAISKGDDWKYSVPATSVICSDGTVTLN